MAIFFQLPSFIELLNMFVKINSPPNKINFITGSELIIWPENIRSRIVDPNNPNKKVSVNAVV